MADGEDIHNQPPGDKPGEGAGNDNKSIANVIRDGVGVVASGVVAGMAFSLEHKFIGIVFTYVAVAAALHVPFELYAERHKAWCCRTWISYGVLLAIIAVIFAACAAQVLRPEPKPRLAVMLNTSHAPNDFLWMTNDFLIFSNRNLATPFVSSETNAYLFIPFNDGETNIALNFFVVNDPTSGSAIDAPEIDFIFPKDAVFSFEDRWETNGLPIPQNPSRMLWFSKPEKTLLPGSGFTAPQLVFNPTMAFANNTYMPDGWVSMRLRGKTNNGEVIEQVLCFWMIFFPITTNFPNLVSPRLIPPNKIELTHTKTNSHFNFIYK